MGFERARAAVQDGLMAGGDARRVVAVLPDDPDVARRLIETVMRDYATELERALADRSSSLYGQDAAAFMRQYDTLWQAKLML